MRWRIKGLPSWFWITVRPLGPLGVLSGVQTGFRRQGHGFGAFPSSSEHSEHCFCLHMHCLEGFTRDALGGPWGVIRGSILFMSTGAWFWTSFRFVGPLQPFVLSRGARFWDHRLTMAIIISSSTTSVTMSVDILAQVFSASPWCRNDGLCPESAV